MSFVSSQCLDSLHTVSCCEFEGTFVARMGIPYFLSQINWGLFAGCPFKVTLTTSGFCGIQVGTANWTGCRRFQIDDVGSAHRRKWSVVTLVSNFARMGRVLPLVHCASVSDCETSWGKYLEGILSFHSIAIPHYADWNLWISEPKSPGVGFHKRKREEAECWGSFGYWFECRLTFYSISWLSSRRETTRILALTFFDLAVHTFLKSGKEWYISVVPLRGWWDVQLECNNETDVFFKTHNAISKYQVPSINTRILSWDSSTMTISRKPTPTTRSFQLPVSSRLEYFVQMDLLVFIIRWSIYRISEL
jgi:hypothetical protein